MFESRILRPTLGGAEALPYEELVERFGFQSPMKAMNLLITARRMFARLLRSVIEEYAIDRAEVDAELDAVLSGLGFDGWWAGRVALFTL